jgi:cell division protein FtsQ
MHIRVVEHRPAAMALTGSTRIPVAADGTALEGLPVHGRLPLVRTRGGIKGTRLADPVALRAARIAGAAPAALRGRVLEIELDAERGYVAQLRSGPEIVFGGASEVRAKWIAAARVLADPEAQGASYVDVRVPGRPAVGGLGFQVTTPQLPAAPTALLEQGAVAGVAAAGTDAEAPATEADPSTPEPTTAEPVTTAPQDAVTPAPEAGGGVAVAPSP